MDSGARNMSDQLFEEWITNPGIPEKTVMRSELFRLQTYSKWPQTACAFPTQLAKAGFYFSKPPDEVICFTCQGKVSNWQFSDNPADVHRGRYPECGFILGEDDTNIPFGPKEDAEQVGAVSHQGNEPESLNGEAANTESSEAEESDDDLPVGLDPTTKLDKGNNNIVESAWQEAESAGNNSTNRPFQLTCQLSADLVTDKVNIALEIDFRRDIMQRGPTPSAN